MAYTKKVKETEVQQELHIDALKQGRIKVRIIGRTGLYFNAMSMKAMRSLVLGGGKKTAAEKREIKHDPETEFVASTYKVPTGPTLLGFPAGGIKKAMASATKDTAGIAGTEIKRLIFLPQDMISVWGRPYLRMDVVRSADMNRTPDIRTRAFLPEWCAEIDLTYITPALNPAGLVTLLSNAGIVCGIGDNRQEKGSGNFGTFDVLTEGDADQEKFWKDLTQNEGRAVQVTAMDKPQAFDDLTRELWDFLKGERNRREASANEAPLDKPKRGRGRPARPEVTTAELVAVAKRIEKRKKGNGRKGVNA